MGYFSTLTVLAPAMGQDLASLASAKVELDIPSNDSSHDAFLRQAIAQASAKIAIHCKRTFAPELVQEVLDIQQDAYPYQTPGGFSELPLSRWPALSVQSVVQSGSSSSALTQDKDFRVDSTSSALLRLNPFSGAGTTWDAMPVTVTYVAGYGQQVLEQHSVPASAPYTVTVQQNASFSCDIALAFSASGLPLTRVAGAPSTGQYAVSAGDYTFSAADAGKAISFSYATFAVPADLSEIVLRLVTARFRGRGRDPALVEQETPNIGRQRFWFGGAPGQNGPFPPDIEAALEPYRMPTVA